MSENLLERVAQWLQIDPDGDDRREIARLVAAHDVDELRRRFDHPLTFGTAGLRGPLMAGPAGMNRLQVRRATQGVIAWLHDLGRDVSRGVVVGRDARHGSATFADEVVSVLLGAGVDVWEMPRELPTPLTAYAVKALGAVAGIMITASHNPKGDNGYKLYGADGSQIIAPHDATIEAFMREVAVPPLADRTSLHHRFVPSDVLEQYREHFVSRFAVGQGQLPVTYTALHGVGGHFTTQLLARAGCRQIHVVASQIAPDPDFPTVAFPNPEEPGALDEAIRTANETGSDLIIANDPDADRLGVAVRRRDGQWRVLHGDEIGWLLGAQALENCGPHDVVATSLVSSTLLSHMAQAKGVDCVITLTGFKWLSKAGGSRRLAFAYEEALGYAVDPLVPDKDGVSAALAIVSLAEQLAQGNRTLLDALDDLERNFGVHRTQQLSLRTSGGRDILTQTVERIRLSPPTALGGVAVSEVIDLAPGGRELPPTDGLWWQLGASGRVVVRPSGTEPKLKAYVEVIVPSDDLEVARHEADELVARVIDDLGVVLALRP